MPNREQVKTACKRCRERRSKCNGEQPCKRCAQNHETCEYSRKQWVSKGDLRAEIGRLRQTLEASGSGVGGGGGVSLLSADRSSSTTNQHSSIAQSTTTDRTTLQAWINGIKTPNAESALGQSTTLENASNSNPPVWSDWQQGGGGVALPPTSPVRTNTTPAVPSCFDHLLSWRACHPTFRERNTRPSSSRRPSTETSLPLAHLDPFGSASQTDVWTDTGWTRAYIRHLFDILVTWDSIAFGLLRKDEFLLDYEAGSPRFCSSALVYALLALSTRIINDNEDDSDVLRSGRFESKQFLLRAEALLRYQGPAPQDLPDIQATGILALYHLRCGQENEARELTESCSSSIRALCLRDTAHETSHEDYVKVRATTYCGAISQRRMLCMTTGILFNEGGGALQEDLILDQFSCHRIGTAATTANASTDAATNSQPANTQLLIVKMFQLTEWVYIFISANQGAHRLVPGEITSTYTKCLGWYRDLFQLIDHGRSRTPFTLFVHMYYHFCLLCAFRPCVGNESLIPDVWPHDMCAQAVQSILSLAQSYDDLFTLRRVSALVPYFVCAAGLFSLAVEDSGSRLDFVQLRPQGAVQLPGSVDIVPQASEAQIKVSTVTQARLLLSKMGATHPAAAMAEEKLTEGLRSWRRSSRLG